MNMSFTVSYNNRLTSIFRLGKTLQSLVAIAISHSSNTDQPAYSKRSLVVCPSSVVGHWVGEIHRFFPQSQVLSPFDFTGPSKIRRQAWNEEGNKYNIIVTSYSVLRSDIHLLEKEIWDYCILDEGHLLKNPKTSK
jgi:TATA-binding protein-associated factor